MPTINAGKIVRVGNVNDKKKEKESRSTKWGSRMNPNFPMQYETHIPMRFDQQRGTPEERQTYAEEHERIFGEKNSEESLTIKELQEKRAKEALEKDKQMADNWARTFGKRTP